MKYLYSEVDYPNDVNCKNNLFQAYKRIGELDPYNVKRFTLMRKPSKKNALQSRPSDNQLIQRGILNVRRRLNHNLGKSGKYTNRMLMRTANVKMIIKNGNLWMGSSVPKMDYLHITIETYLILQKYDWDYCKKLLGIEKNDTYPSQDINRHLATKVITPIQTNIFLRSIGETLEAESFMEALKTIIC